MDVIDYGLSFIQCKWPFNTVRFWVESRTRVIDQKRGATEDYYQCASCKSEETFGEKDLFLPDNYDFLPIFGPEMGVIFRRRAWLNPNYKTCVPVNQMWEGPMYDGIRRPATAELLPDFAAIERATREFRPIVAQTEVANDAGDIRVTYEYPVKTMNINREHSWHQTDTGPIAYLDLTKPHDRTVDAISLAFAAFNVPHFCDFVVEEPTPIVKDGNEACSVYHYSNRVSLKAQNRLYALPR